MGGDAWQAPRALDPTLARPRLTCARHELRTARPPPPPPPPQRTAPQNCHSRTRQPAGRRLYPHTPTSDCSDEYAALSPERRGSLSAARAAQLERRVYKGVPDAVRGLVWQALGGSRSWEWHRYHELRTQALSDSSGLDPVARR